MARIRKIDWNALNETIKKTVGGGEKQTYDDDVLYKPKSDEQGNSNVLIRFLPPPLDEDLPFVKSFNHGFKSIGGWYIENCPTTTGKECPICKYNNTQWEIDKDGVRSRKRNTNYFANILVIKDPLAPENEGKVFKFRYGIKIHNLIMEKIAPDSEIDEQINVFDYIEGANFRLKKKMVSVAGFSKPLPNYDTSSFAEKSPIALNGKPLTEEEINELDTKLHSLKEHIDGSKEKSYSELADIFTKKTGIRIPLNPNEEIVTPKKEETMKTFNDTLNSFNDEDDEDDKSNGSSFVNDDEENDDDFFARLREG